MELTFAQACALDRFRNWVIGTGAGAGKTRTLTERYVHLLKHDAEATLRNIVALTFTQKAAAEMKARVYAALRAVLTETDLEPEIRKRIGDLKDSAEDTSVMTIHAFCLQILRQYPVEAGVDSNLFLLSEFDVKSLLAESFQTVFRRFIRKGHGAEGQVENRVILNLLKVWEPAMLRRETLSLLLQPVRYEKFLRMFQEAALDSDQFFHRIAADWKLEFIRGLSDGDFRRRIAESLSLARSEGLAEEISAGFQDLISHLNDLEAGTESALDRMLEVLRNEAFLSKVPTTRGGNPFPFPKKDLQEVLERLQRVLSPDIAFEQNAFILLGDLITFVNEVRGEYERTCERRNALDFDMVQKRTLHLLRDNSEVLREMRQNIRYLFVDEFQDTDDQQWEVIRLLCQKENLALSQGKVFAVGDEKQAIYGFRGGDVQVFRDASRELKESNALAPNLSFDGCPRQARSRYESMWKELLAKRSEQADEIRSGQLQFGENFRSHRVPIEFFNSFFSQLFRPEEGNDPPHQEMICTKDPNALPGSVEVLMIPSEAETDDPNEMEAEGDPAAEDGLDGEILQGSMRIEATTLALWVTEHLSRAPIKEGPSGVPGGPKIAVLFRRFTHVKLYEQAFRDQGIDVFVHRGRGFFERPEILDLYNVLEFLHDTRKNINFVGLLRTSVFGFRDEEIWNIVKEGEDPALFWRFQSSENEQARAAVQRLKLWLELKDRLRLSELIRHIVADSAWNAVHSSGIRGQQTKRNVEKLIEMARTFEAQGVRGLSEFCEFLRDQLRAGEQEGEAQLDELGNCDVIFMTIHQAKGLQFDTVILPDLSAKFQGSPQAILETIRGLNDYFLGVRIPNPVKGYAKEDTMVREIVRRRRSRNQLAEEKRLFYVGCTRAVKHLLLVGQDPKKKTEVPIQKASRVWDWVRTLLQLDSLQFENARAVVRINVPNGDLEIPVLSRAIRVAIRREVPPLNAELPRSIYVEPLKGGGVTNVSATSFLRFQECPRKFYFREVACIPEAFSGLQGRDSEEQNLDAALQGDLVHRMLEHSDLLLSSEDKTKMVQALLERERSRLPEVRHETVKWNEAADEILSHVGRVMGDPAWKLLRTKAQGAHARFSELPFEIEVAGLRIRGKIDEALRVGKGWTLVDYKTNRLSKKRGMAEVMHDNHYDLQLNLYALAAERIWGEGSVESLVLHFSSPGGGRLEVARQPEETHRRIEEMALQVTGENVYALAHAVPRSDRSCSSCRFQASGVCSYMRKS